MHRFVIGLLQLYYSDIDSCGGQAENPECMWTASVPPCGMLTLHAVLIAPHVRPIREQAGGAHNAVSAASESWTVSSIVCTYVHLLCL